MLVSWTVSKQPTYSCLLQHHGVAHQLFMNFEKLLSCAGCHSLLISNIVVKVVRRDHSFAT